MKVGILKKINNYIRIVQNDDGGFDVQNRKYLGWGKNFSDWNIINTFSTFKKAVDKKNSYIVMILMRDLGYRNKFVKKRTKRKKL